MAYKAHSRCHSSKQSQSGCQGGIVTGIMFPEAQDQTACHHAAEAGKLHCSQVPVGISVDPAYIKTGQIPGRYCEKEKQAVNKQCFADCSRRAGIADADADFVQRERRILLVFLCGKREAAQDSHTKDGSENISHERCPERV